MTEGLLQEMPLIQVAQLFAMSEVTGDLELTPLYPLRHQQGANPVGHIFFQQGKMHSAFLRDRNGDAAIENFFFWEAGKFAFHPLLPNQLPPPNIAGETDLLLIRGAMRLEQWRSDRIIIPTTRMILRRTTGPTNSPPPEIHKPAASLLPLCDGNRQLGTIITQLKLGGLRGREAAAQLIRDGYATPLPPSPGERLVRLIVTTAHSYLGIGAELFCDEALLQVNIQPDGLALVPMIYIPEVDAIVTAMEHEVTMVLGVQRARMLATELRLALGLRDITVMSQEIHHV